MMVCKRNLAALIFVLSSVLQCIALDYDSSKTYSYSYETDLHLNDANSKRATRAQQDVGVKLSVSFQLSTLFKNSEVQLFKLSIVKAQASSILRPDVQTDLGGTLALPVYFQVAGDVVDRLHFVSRDTTFSRNIKKGIVALFQVKESAGQRTEVDVSGECQVTYTSPQAGFIDRLKTDCQNLEIAGQFSTANKALGVSVWAKSTQHYQLKDSIIDSVTGTHRTITYLNIRAALNGLASSSQKLQFETTSAGESQAGSVEEALAAAASEAGSGLEVSLLPSEEENQQCTEGCESPKKLVAKLADDLSTDNMATVRSAKAFAQLLQSFRDSGKSTLAETFVIPESYYIVPQLIDVATAAQTEASREAILELLNFEDENAVDYPQRFLFAAAYSSHPSTSLIRELLSVLKNPVPNADLHQSLFLSLGAMVHSFCQVKEQCSDPIVDEFRQLVIEGLSACTEEPCKLMYLRAMGNAGLPASVPIILPFAESTSSAMLASTAISAFRRIHKRFLGQQVRDALARVYHQNKASYDSTVRIAALEVLLELEPSAPLVRNVLLSCLEQGNPEFSTYVVRMLLDAATANAHLREVLAIVLKEPYFNNYNVLSQKGKSSVITSFLARMKDVNSTYNLFFENSPSGVMKRSGMIVNLVGKTIKQPFMKFGIYADGLESLVGEAASEGEDDNSEASSEGSEPTAGMSFYFMDVLLTQVEFFRGTSGLMSAAWNAPSELTSALQGNLLLQDHSQRIHLSNGLVLDTKVRGVLSMDLSGLISISLWNRNCEALIRNSGALYLEGSLKLLSKDLELGLTFSGEGQSNIDFTSNADFYEMPLKLCMQMKRPEFQFLQKTQKYEKIQKSKRYRSSTRVKCQMSGESYFLNKANSEECRVMLKDEE
ncbi:microsomal triglyceride transfer protein large subunit [Aplysia californica]|uniref:Microsomal triglyceride transfer protein large subunit n=1 Tax=Aplysia californica TaxID=6500 RepID=A0ABM0JD85_APLCA|nr:microsomal triglyceride transfer protein large subunit [Aplysia californica]XP_005091026.1 microsomal triglyceride transfer protein large subunit [Aplysia californica]XP_005091027.1 microsomal triglyceride transfer protein large subunit [Aplysia californica]